MARRTAKPVDYREPLRFVEVMANFANSIERYYIGVERLTAFETQRDLGIYLDAHFGLPQLCQLAALGWSRMDARIRVYDTLARDIQAHNAKHPRNPHPMPLLDERTVGGIPLGVHYFSIFPSLPNRHRFSIRVPSQYEGMPYHSINGVPTLRTPFSEERPVHCLMLDTKLDEWVSAARSRAQDTHNAMQFLFSVARQVGCTASLFRALPGLRSVCTTLRAHARINDVFTALLITEAEKPRRGKDFINDGALTLRLGMWRTDWTSVHRPVLMALAAAQQADVHPMSGTALQLDPML